MPSLKWLLGLAAVTLSVGIAFPQRLPIRVRRYGSAYLLAFGVLVSAVGFVDPNRWLLASGLFCTICATPGAVYELRRREPAPDLRTMWRDSGLRRKTN